MHNNDLSDKADKSEVYDYKVVDFITASSVNVTANSVGTIDIASDITANTPSGYTVDNFWPVCVIPQNAAAAAMVTNISSLTTYHVYGSVTQPYKVKVAMLCKKALG